MRQDRIRVLQRSVPRRREGCLRFACLEWRSRDPGNSAIAPFVLAMPRPHQRDAVSRANRGLTRRLLHSHDGTDSIADNVGSSFSLVGGDRLLDLTMESVGRANAVVVAAIEAREVGDVAQLHECAVAVVEAAIRRQELVNGRERAREIGQIQKVELARAVDDGVDSVERAAVRRAKRHQGSHVTPAAEYLEKVSRDEPAHRVRDEHHLGVGVLLATRRQPDGALALQLARRDAIVATPVVRQREVAHTRLELEPLAQPLARPWCSRRWSTGRGRDARRRPGASRERRRRGRRGQGRRSRG